MTPKFDDFEQDNLTNQEELTELPTDCFELLSSYIDGELSAAEKKQVQQWLDQDPQIKQLYTQLLKLQSNMQRSMATTCDKSTAQITAGVFQSIDHHHRQRKLIWCGSAIAATIMATLTGIIPGFNPLKLQIANQSRTQEAAPTVMLAVAVDKPAINIPKGISGYDIELQNFIEN
ncbi:MAG: zf-HC2 domain-containing protein [Cyanobacteria bacterium P01_A01_bin.83]